MDGIGWIVGGSKSGGSDEVTLIIFSFGGCWRWLELRDTGGARLRCGQSHVIKPSSLSQSINDHAIGCSQQNAVSSA